MILYHNVEELNGNYLTDAFDAEIMAVDCVDIVYQDHQYTEYAAEIVEDDTLKEYDNLVVETVGMERSPLSGIPAGRLF